MTTPIVTLACTSLAFSRLSLDEALEGVARLGFRNVDLGAVEGWAHVQPSRLVADPSATARIERSLEHTGLDAVALNAAVGPLEAAADVRVRVEALVELAERLGASVITVQAPHSGMTVDQAAALLEPVCAVAALTSVLLTLETHRGSITERPEEAIALAERTGLGLTLDPSHLIAGPAAGEGLAALIEHTRHLHVRDARDDALEVTIGEGTVPFQVLFDRLAAAGSTGTVSVEYIEGGTGRTIEEDLVRAGRYVAAHWPGGVEGASALVDAATG